MTLRLLGYSDRLTAAPGDTIRFMVSCDAPEYESRLVRLIHGDTNPEGPGFKQVEIDSARAEADRFAGPLIEATSVTTVVLAGAAIAVGLAAYADLSPAPAVGEDPALAPAE